MIKVLIASFTFPPNKDGVAEAASTMAAGFLAKGWQVDVATGPSETPRSGMEWRGARIHEFTITGDEHPKHFYQGDVGKYRKFLMGGEWDVVIFHAYLWSLYVPFDLLDKIKGRTVVVSHGFAALQWVRAKSFPWGLGVWLWSLYRSAEMFFWLSKVDRTVYLSNQTDFRGFFDHRIAKIRRYEGRRVVPNGVDPDLRGNSAHELRREWGVTSDQVLFLCVANYSRRKDQGYAARAFRRANLGNATLVFVGSEFNGYSSRFQAEDDLIPSHRKAGRIIWLEGLDRSSTLDAFAACDIFVLSADHEAQPIALLEAMRESKPWIARDAGCIPEMPGGICVHSVTEMASQMVRLSADPGMRTFLGGKGRSAVEKIYNQKRYTDSYCDLVLELTS